MAYAGHLDSYAKCNEILQQFLSIEVNPSQVYRVTDYVSESLHSEDDNATRLLPALSKNDVLYVEIDGSMICTRNKDCWKEIKLARLFKGSDCLNPNSTCSYLRESQYVGHFGNSTDFGKKLQKVIDSYGDLNQRLVFLTDGAAWIREWIANNYLFSCSILDFFHVMEHLYQFADIAFVDDASAKEQWCMQQKELLLSSDVENVIKNISCVKGSDKEKKQLISYYQTNKNRMRYEYYRSVGCGIIGSGAIESAHRTVIQRRMKLSGQRWSSAGVTNMLRLRVLSMNNQWSKVIDFLKMPQMKMAA
jgi:hypothetical protein